MDSNPKFSAQMVRKCMMALHLMFLYDYGAFGELLLAEAVFSPVNSDLAYRTSITALIIGEVKRYGDLMRNCRLRADNIELV